MASERDNPIQNKTDAVHEHTQSTQERYYPQFPSRTEVSFPPTIEKDYTASQGRQEARDIRKLWLEGAMVLIVIVSTVISLNMWNEMRKSTEAAKLSADASVAATAAWMTMYRATSKGIEKNVVMFEFKFKNVGKTPALNVSAAWEFNVVPANLAYVQSFDPYQCPAIGPQPGIIPPDETIIFEANTRLSDEQLKLLTTGVQKVFIHGCVKYHDVLSDKDRVTEIGAFYPAFGVELTDLRVGIYAPYNRMK